MLVLYLSKTANVVGTIYLSEFLYLKGINGRNRVIIVGYLKLFSV